jgi:hypothetical protein
MAQPSTTREVQKRAKEQHLKNVERALKEERTGLVAIARVFLEEAENPGAVIRRLEAMVRAAENGNTPARTRDALRYGYQVLSRAAEQAQGKPQGLFDPNVGHVRTDAVNRLVNSQDHQVGLFATNREPLRDVVDAGQERAQFSTKTREIILGCYRDLGELTDDELAAECQLKRVFVTRGTLKSYRKELTRLGRLIKGTATAGGEPRWKLMEHNS